MPFLSEQDLEGNEGEAEEEVLTGWAKKEAHALGGAGVGSRAAHFCIWCLPIHYNPVMNQRAKHPTHC